MDGLWWKTQLKWMIWGYHYFWKHPYVLKPAVTITAKLAGFKFCQKNNPPKLAPTKMCNVDGRQLSWWSFPIFFMFTPIWGRFPFWIIFFRWVETTSQLFILLSEKGCHVSLWVSACCSYDGPKVFVGACRCWYTKIQAYPHSWYGRS